MRNGDATDDNALCGRPDRLTNGPVELPNLWDVVEELERGLVGDSGTVSLDPRQPRASGLILPALSWLLQFLIEGFAACGYGMYPYMIDPNETFNSWEERTRRTKQDVAPRRGGVSQEASGKW